MIGSDRTRRLDHLVVRDVMGRSSGLLRGDGPTPRAGIRDEGEAVLPLELGAIASMRVSSSNVSWIRGADRLHELEEVLRLDLLVVDEQEIREDVIVAFVQLVEIQP